MLPFFIITSCDIIIIKSSNGEIVTQIKSIFLFCFSKKETKKEPRNRYTARLREGALINFSSSVESTSVILLLEQKI